MPIQHIHTYLVHAGRASDEAPKIGGATVKLQDKLFTLLNSIYSAADHECDIDIAFSPTDDGKQQNPCRDLIVRYMGDPSLAHGRQIAERLEKMTDHRSGLGLLFLIAGREGKDHKFVISRFPTDSAVLADQTQSGLTVEFLERVFMKSKFSYKAVMFRGASLKDLWTGRAIDKQINSQSGEPSNYWIVDFLNSDFSLTPAAGTRRLATALRKAAKKSNLDVTAEIVAATTLASGLKGHRTSIDDFLDRFSLSPAAKEAIRDELKSPGLAAERFQFDWNEFNSLIGYRSVELDNGAMMTAPASEFDKVFEQQVVSKTEKEVRFSTRGRVVNEKLKKVK